MKMIDHYLPLKARKKELKVFYGTLTASDWNNLDEPTQFSLFTIDEDDLLLGSPHLKKKYLKLLNQPVEVIGEKKLNEYGDEYIQVSKIRRINYPKFQFLSKYNRNNEMIEIEEYSPPAPVYFHQLSA